MADGSIRIPVDVDIDAAENDLDKLRDAAERAAEEIARASAHIAEAAVPTTSKGWSKEFEKTLSAMAKTGAEADAAAKSGDIEAADRLGQLYDDQERKLAAIAQRLNETVMLEQQRASEAAIQKTAADEGKRKAAAEKEAAKEAQKLRKEQEKAAAASKKHGDKIKSAIGGQIKAVIGKIGMMGVALMGVGSAMQIVRNAINDVKSENEYVAGQLAGFRNIIATAIEPIVVRVVQWLSVALSYVNAFITALTGVDMIANANAKAIDKQAKATAGAAKAAGQLAGFDEMNKLSDDSGGGGGGGASGLFEVPDVDTAKITAFLEKAKGLVGDLGIAEKFEGAVPAAEHLIETVKQDVSEWDLAPMTESVLNLLATLMPDFQKIIEDGEWFWTHVIEPIAQWSVETVIPALIDTVTKGLQMLRSIAEPLWEGLKKAWEKIEQSTVFQYLQDLAMDTIADVQYAFETVTAVFTDEGSELSQLFSDIADVVLWVWSKVEPYFILAKDVASAVFRFVVDTVGSAIRSIIKVVRGLVNIIAGILTGDWSRVWDGLKLVVSGVWDSIRGLIDAAKKFIVSIFGSIGGFVTTWITNAKERFITRLKNLIESAKSVFNSFKDFFANFGENMKNIGKGIVNGIIGLGESMQHGIADAYNKMVEGLNKLSISFPDWVPIVGGKSFSINLPTMPRVYLPRLAAGGIVNNPGRGVPLVAGEAGREAVLPLDNNTEWMDALAERINGGANGRPLQIQLNINGRKLQEFLIDLGARRAFATNGGAV